MNNQHSRVSDNQQLLFHGTASESALSIAETGFSTEEVWFTRKPNVAAHYGFVRAVDRAKEDEAWPKVQAIGLSILGYIIDKDILESNKTNYVIKRGLLHRFGQLVAETAIEYAFEPSHARFYKFDPLKIKSLTFHVHQPAQGLFHREREAVTETFRSAIFDSLAISDKSRCEQ